MSQGFGQGSINLDALKQKLEEAGITGKKHQIHFIKVGKRGLIRLIVR
jgi:predicted regulator of Ras-like GTPase activity (Roadblock/LC7/MglB family)